MSAGETFYPLQLPSTRGLPLLTFVEDTMNYAGAGVAADANAAPKISARKSALLASCRIAPASRSGTGRLAAQDRRVVADELGGVVVGS